MHLILDNYGTHKTALIRNWLLKRFHVHFTPTYGSWLNLVERWFAELTNKRIRRGAFRSVKELQSAIREFIEVHNENPKPFVWTRTEIRFWTAWPALPAALSPRIPPESVHEPMLQETSLA